MVAIMAYLWTDSFLVDNFEVELRQQIPRLYNDPIRIVLSDNKIEPKIVSFSSPRSGALHRKITFIKLWKSQF